MKKNIKNTVRTILVAMMMTVLFAGAAFAAERAVGTVERTSEFRNEALKEKATKIEKAEVETEETVEATVEATEETEVTFEEIVVETEETVVEETVEEIEVVTEETEVVETVEEVEAVVETAEEFVEEDEMEMEAELASTAEGTGVSAEVKTIDAATGSASADEVVVEFANIANSANAAANTAKTGDVNAKYLGTAGGTRKAITLIGDSTFRDVNKLQAAIDADNIVCYPTADMTKGVKYMAGHNPGAMSHIAGLKVGSIVRLSNDEGHQDYQIREIKQGSGSFSSITFNTTKGVMDAWTMIKSGTENAVIVQYCVNGVNTLHYGVAL